MDSTYSHIGLNKHEMCSKRNTIAWLIYIPLVSKLMVSTQNLEQQIKRAQNRLLFSFNWESKGMQIVSLEIRLGWKKTINRLLACSWNVLEFHHYAFTFIFICSYPYSIWIYFRVLGHLLFEVKVLCGAGIVSISHH